jgi:hypothetical protein
VTTPQATRSHERRLQRIKASTILAERRIWSRMSPGERWVEQFVDDVGPKLVALTIAAQVSVTRETDVYVAEVLRELDIERNATSGMVPRSAFAGYAGDGREVAALLGQSVAVAGASYTNAAVQAEPTAVAALQKAQRWLDMAVSTVLADTARGTEASSMTGRRGVGGYVRMLSPPSCSRCAVLAGKFYRWNTGFLRHPRCDCRHIPASEGIAGDLTTNPNTYFDSLSASEQDQLFTTSGAQAIRDGADMSQVVNARRGMRTAQVYGHDVLVTTEGTTRRGVAYRALNSRFQNRAGDIRGRGDRYFRTTNVRLMPDSIYTLADGDRAEAIRLMKLHGYLN